MYVISRKIIYPDAINDKPVENPKNNEYIFDFKLEHSNERTIVQGRNYWVDAWMKNQEWNARKQHLDYKSSDASLTVFGKAGIVTIYKIEGEFEEWQIKTVKNALASGIAIESICEQIETLGWRVLVTYKDG